MSAAATAQGAAAGSSTSALLKGTLKLMAWTKLKTAAVAGVVILLAAGTAVVAVKTRRPAAINPAEVEKMWGEYAQAMAISGPTADGAIHAAVQVMRNHPPMASIRLGQRRPLPGPCASASSFRRTAIVDKQPTERQFPSPPVQPVRLSPSP